MTLMTLMTLFLYICLASLRYIMQNWDMFKNVRDCEI
jgi:hypothetical protein